MNIKHIAKGSLLALAAVVAASCSNISENERLIYVEPETPEPTEVAQNVLIEDFTGQRCSNCPDGTETINEIMKAYGEDRVIAVGIHSGPLGFAGNAKFEGLMTDEGNEYYNRWDSEKKLGQPWVLFNRSTSPNTNRTTWLSEVRTLISNKAPMSMDIANSYDATSRQLTVDVTMTGATGDSQGKLQVWLIEDGIVGIQTMGDGKNNQQYVHNHVFRTSVNGTWGEDVAVKLAEATKKQYTYTISDKWKAENMAVVAFVYNDSGVLQVTKKAVVAKTAE